MQSEKRPLGADLIRNMGESHLDYLKRLTASHTPIYVNPAYQPQQKDPHAKRKIYNDINRTHYN